MADDERKKKVRSRGGIVGYLNKLVKTDLAKIYAEFKDDDLISLVSYKDVLEEKLQTVMILSEEIQDATADPTEYQADFDKYMDIEVSFRRDITKLKKFILEKEKPGSVPDTKKSVRSETKRSANRWQWGKFEFKKFSGDPTCWTSFKESFDAAVGSNSDMQDFEKMNFLRNHLKGEAESVIKGLALSNANYGIAYKMLEERYGHKQALISVHMQKLIQVEPILELSDVKGLRKLHDEVETHVRSLSSLGLDPTGFGSMLSPVLMTKLPEELQVKIITHCGKSMWDITSIMKYYNAELEAREKVMLTNKVEEDERFNTTGAALYAGVSTSQENYNTGRDFRRGNRRGRGNQRSFRGSNYSRGNGRFGSNNRDQSKNECFFCGRNHQSTSCNTVTKPEVRKAMLFKERRCFKCFKGAHDAKDCYNQIVCLKCQGAHHASICTFERKPPPPPPPPIPPATNNFVSACKRNSVLLQTARAQVTSEDGKYSRNVRILFDSGSQMSYIIPRARDELKLSTIKKIDLMVNTFGNSQSVKSVDVCRFVVRCRDKDVNIIVTAIVSDICFPVEEQKIDLAKSNYSHLRNLELADSNPGELPLDIDILIGGDHYWDIMQHEIIRGNSGPVAISSALDMF